MPKTLNVGPEEVAIDLLTPHPRNVNEGDFGTIQESVEANGFYGRVVANKRTGHILAGNHRYHVAKQLGFESLPVEWIDVDEDTELRILVADNRTARLGHDNDAALAELLAELAATNSGLTGTGFGGDDLDRLINDLANPLKPTSAANDPNAEWVGMPEYQHDDLTADAAFTLRVFFANAQELDEFGKLIGKDCTGRKFVWFGKQPQGKTFEVVDGSEA